MYFVLWMPTEYGVSWIKQCGAQDSDRASNAKPSPVLIPCCGARGAYLTRGSATTCTLLFPT